MPLLAIAGYQIHQDQNEGLFCAQPAWSVGQLAWSLSKEILQGIQCHSDVTENAELSELNNLNP